MAAGRKLATEIDRCLKQVAERVEIFEETWDKVQDASNPNQKEKYEGDLKKEIKKLQRLRDQIKTWLANSDVKVQRTVLMEKRRLIEVQMERFKIIERETKTKAFSKEGLALAAKVDPATRERNAVREWLNGCVSELNQQIEQFEAELESMSGGGKKKKRSSDEEKEDALNDQIVRHNFHIQKLEMLIRLVDQGENDGLDRRIKETLEDDLSYYINENSDPDFAENEYMYDDFDEEITAGPAAEVQESVRSRKESESAAEKKAEQEKREKKAAKEAAAAKKEKEKQEKAAAAEEKKRKQAEAVAAKAAAQKAKEASKASSQGLVAVGGRVGKQTPSASAAMAGASTSTTTLTSDAPRLPVGGINFAAAASAAAIQPQVSKSSPSLSQGGAPGSWSSAPGQGPPGAFSNRPGGPRQMPPPNQPQQQVPRGVGQVGLGNVPIGVPAGMRPGAGPSGGAPPTTGPATPNMQQYSGRKPEGVGGLAQGSVQMLAASAAFLPEQQDQTRSFTPANPHPAPACYPDKPPAHFNQQKFFANLDTDTLLFIFYYQQGTYQQYLAARELKKQAWRFHKKYLTWFQRHEEPKIITDEFEQGTYVYFDFEQGWCQRKKTDFTFEYRFLEDHDLV